MQIPSRLVEDTRMGQTSIIQGCDVHMNLGNILVNRVVLLHKSSPREHEIGENITFRAFQKFEIMILIYTSNKH